MLILSFLLMNFFASKKVLPEKKPMLANEIYVKASEVKYEKVLTEVLASGRINSQAEVDLSSEVQGRLIAGDLKFKKGMSFKKGDVLLRIFSDDIAYNLKSRKSSFLTSLAGILPDMKIDFPTSYPVWLSFFNSIEISKNLQELPKVNDPKEKVFLSSRGILTEYYSIKAEEVRLNKYSIVAPFDGSLTEAFQEVGAVTNPGTRLASMIRTDQLEVEVPINARDAAHLKIGAEAKLSADGVSGEWSGKIIRKSSFVESQSQSIPIYIALEYDKANPVYQGQYLSVVFRDLEFDNAFTLPRNAVFNNDQVYTVEEGLLKKHRIEVLHFGESTMIISGLTEGTMVVNEPLINVTENMKVEILD